MIDNKTLELIDLQEELLRETERLAFVAFWIIDEGKKIGEQVGL